MRQRDKGLDVLPLVHYSSGRVVVPFVIAGALMALAFGAHVFIGTRETLSLRRAGGS